MKNEPIESNNFLQELITEGLVQVSSTEIEAKNLFARLLRIISIGHLGLVRKDITYTSELNPDDVWMTTRIANITKRTVRLQDLELNKMELADVLEYGKKRYAIRNRSKNN